MSYQVLARKYRPASFSTVSGQEHVTRTLCNAIEQDRIGHAFLFAGPRGVGKTSIARILSKALNCEKGPTTDPCLECSNCIDVTNGTSIAVREIDGASHNSVDNVRELIESFRSLPPPGSRNKIYIIDEVHMLSTAAFNALLKSLEEPPPNTIFILATTEPHKIPDTVISRCQRHDFRALDVQVILDRFAQILEAENVSADPEALRMIARLAEGSMRDAQSLLERVRSFCSGEITAAEASQALGTVEQRMLSDMAASIFSGDVAQGLSHVERAFSTGVDPALFFKEFVSFWRTLLIAKYDSGSLLQQFGVTADEASDFQALVESIPGEDLQDLVSLARDGADSALRSAYPRYAFEALVVKMTTRTPVKELGEMLGRMRALLSSKGKGKGAAPRRSSPKPSPARPTAQAKELTPPPKVSETPTPSRKATLPEAPVLESSADESPLDEEEEVNAQPSIVSTEKFSEIETVSQWAAFVESARGTASPILCEKLKRLSIDVLAPGELSAKAPKIVVDYFDLQENKNKLQSLLATYFGKPHWKMKLEASKGNSTAEPGSLRDREEKQRILDEQKRKKELSDHPRVTELKQAFPGSKVEKIELKAGNDG